MIHHAHGAYIRAKATGTPLIACMRTCVLRDDPGFVDRQLLPLRKAGTQDQSSALRYISLADHGF